MLRIRHRNAPDTVLFEQSGLKRAHLRDKIAEHLRYWSKTQVGVDENNQPIVRDVSPDEWIFEWVEGDKVEILKP